MSGGAPIPSEAELSELLTRDSSRLSARERAAEAFLAAGFLVAIALLVAVDGWHTPPIEATLISVFVMALAMHVRFDAGPGFTVPTQLAFVPLMVLAGAAALPVAALLAVTLGRLPSVARAETKPSRLLCGPGNTWFALGPALVLAAAGARGAEHAPWLIAPAVAAQLCFDFLAYRVRCVMAQEGDLRSQLSDVAWVYGIDLALTPIGLLAGLAVDESAAAPLALLPLMGLLALFARERRARLESLLELNAAYRGTALVLGDVVEADDGYTGEHCRSVVALALEVAARLGLEEARLRNLEFGALLHDVGKVAIPKEIINKPGKLDPHEWTVIKTHTLEGQRMLDRVGGFMAQVGVIVRSHHERWDGRGYPDGLAGEAIPLEARIIAACDAFNAMTTTRAYRGALPVAVAIDELRAGSGSQFDPQVVDAVIAVAQDDAQPERQAA